MPRVTYHPAPQAGVQQLMFVGDVPAPVLGDRQALAIFFGLGVVAGKTNGIFRLATLAAALALGIAQTRK